MTGSAVGAGVLFCSIVSFAGSSFVARKIPPAITSAAAAAARMIGKGFFVASNGFAVAIRCASSSTEYRSAKIVLREYSAFFSSSGGVEPSRFIGTVSTPLASLAKNVSISVMASFSRSDVNSSMTPLLVGISLSSAISNPFARSASRIGATRSLSASANSGDNFFFRYATFVMTVSLSCAKGKWVTGLK